MSEELDDTVMIEDDKKQDENEDIREELRDNR